MAERSGKIRRRTLLMGSGILAALAATPKWVMAMAAPIFPTRTVERDVFRFDPSEGVFRMPDGKSLAYAFTIDGLTDAPASLSYAQLAALPQVRQTSDFHCVEGWSVKNAPWGGFRFAELLRIAPPGPEAAWAIFHSHGTTRSRPGGLDHYVESFPIADLIDPELDYLMALQLAEKPLPHDRGAPMRVVCPYDLAYKSIKFVTGLTYADAPQNGWWTEANPIYPHYAPVSPQRLRTTAPKRRPY
jgi:DMSO/TMAO reductase YedYZ molybdopterin-dependent catalytic subunit